MRKRLAVALLGLAAGCGPTLEDVRLVQGACGSWTVVGQATGRSAQLVLSEGDTTLRAWTIDGSTGISAQGASRPGGGQVLTLGFVPDGPSEVVVTESFDPAGWVSTTPTEPYAANRAPDLRVQVDPRCLEGRELRVSMEEPRGLVGALVPADGVVAWPLPVLPIGVHGVRGSLEDRGLLFSRFDGQLRVTTPCLDSDGDGIATCDGDCDDQRASVHPGAIDVSGDGLDNDCDGINGVDRDADGYEDAAAGGSDCDDSEPTVHPGAPEGRDADSDGSIAANGIDDDCDGRIDEDLSDLDCDDKDPQVGPHRPEAEAPNGVDDDCDGKVDEGTVAYDDDGDGLSEEDGDCDDGDRRRYPGAKERPDCRDQDCDGEIDEGLTLRQRDDAYEPDDGEAAAKDLGTDGRLRFERSLKLVTRGLADEEWFSFWSDDGPFDDWGIDVTVDAIPDESAYEISVIGPNGVAYDAVMAEADGATVHVRGIALAPDSGRYQLRVRPVRITRPWCPLAITVVSR